MATQRSHSEPRTPSSDPITTVPLWPALLLLIVGGALVVMVLERSGAKALAEKLGAAAGFTGIVAWWLWAVAGATRRAGFRPSIPSVGAMLKLSMTVALCGVLATFVWVLLTHALGLPRLGLVKAPTIRDERTVLSLAFAVLLMGLLALRNDRGLRADCAFHDAATPSSSVGTFTRA